MLSLCQRVKTAVLDQTFVPGTQESILDIGAMTPIIEGTQGTGSRVHLVGVTDAGVDAELAVVFSNVIFLTFLSARPQMSFATSILLAHKQALHFL